MKYLRTLRRPAIALGAFTILTGIVLVFFVAARNGVGTDPFVVPWLAMAGVTCALLARMVL